MEEKVQDLVHEIALFQHAVDHMVLRRALRAAGYHEIDVKDIGDTYQNIVGMADELKVEES